MTITTVLFLFHSLLNIPTTTIHSVTHDECPSEMNQVKGEYCPIVEQKCKTWSTDLGKHRCLLFEPSVCKSKKVPMNFCMDTDPFSVDEKTYESLSVEEAENICKANNKRLCSSEEWTLSCEGPNIIPYPTGFERPTYECNTYASHFSLRDQDGVGRFPHCVSSFGITDMMGLHNEWAIEKGVPIMRGGFWIFNNPHGSCRARYTPPKSQRNTLKMSFRCCQDSP